MAERVHPEALCLPSLSLLDLPWALNTEGTQYALVNEQGVFLLSLPAGAHQRLAADPLGN